MTDLLNTKIGDLAKGNFAYIRLFIKHHVDFYCHGTLTLQEALAESPADEDLFKADLDRVSQQPAEDYHVRIEDWPLDLLADYIQKTHHRYTENAIRAINAMIEEYLRSGQQNIETISQFQKQFVQLMQELAVHMRKEEFMLFPFIRKMVANHGKKDATTNKDMEQPIDMFVHEHESQHILLGEIGKIFQGYQLDTAGDDDLNDIMMVMEELAEDLALHLHLENNILFPETLRMQKEAENSDY